MKRLFFGFLMSVGLLLAGVTNASAGGYCSLDPTVQVGTPVHYSLNLNVSLLSTSLNVYASGTSQTTTFGGGLGLP